VRTITDGGFVRLILLPDFVTELVPDFHSNGSCHPVAIVRPSASR
jgi:hypothetical protein